jgi:hypothetical protein
MSEFVVPPPIAPISTETATAEQLPKTASNLPLLGLLGLLSLGAAVALWAVPKA